MSRYQQPPYQQQYGTNDDFNYPPDGSTTNLAGEEKNGYNPAQANRSKSGKKKWILLGLALLLLIIAGAVLGGVFGSKAARDASANSNKAAQNGGASSSAASASASSASRASSAASRSSSAVSSAASAAPSNVPGSYIVKNLPTWDWGQDKSIGMCLGSWLALERYMLEDWFVGLAGEDAMDEWTLSQKLGDGLGAALEEHWNNWITEDDIQLMFENGINHLRIPTGFWAWIPTVDDEPYYNNMTAYQNQINRILGYAHARGMYATLDLHGLPGSQNGEQHSGHLTETPTFYNNAVNQGRSRDVVRAVMQYVENSPYRSVVTGMQVLNEPRPYTDEQLGECKSFYEDSYQIIQNSSWPIATFFHTAYIGNFTYFRDFAASHATTPPSLILMDHPYPGNFPIQNNTADMLSQVCAAGEKYRNYPVPIVITEWSVYTGVKSQSFEKQFYDSQLAVWSWSAGAMYWSYKLIPSAAQLAQGLDYSQYSFITLVQNSTNVIASPASLGITNTTSRENALAYVAQMQTTCGDVPNDIAPYPVPDTQWSVEIQAKSSQASQSYTATSISNTAAASGITPSVTATVREKTLARVTKRAIQF